MNVTTKSEIISSEVRQSFSLSLPLIASNLMKAASGFIGTVMVSHLGKLALGGMALGTSVFFALVLFFFGMLSAVSILVSQNFGAGNNEGISSVVSQGFILAIVVSIPIFLIIWISPFLFHLTHERREIIHLATVYLRAMSLSVLPFSFLIVMNQFLVGISKAKVVLCISILQMPFEILLTYLFVYGGFGIPKCGLSGVGYAFAIVFSVAALSVGLFIFRSKQYEHLMIFSNFGKIRYKYLFKLIRVGWPIGCLVVIEVALFSSITFLMGRVGDDQLAAYQICRQYMAISLMITFAVSQVATVRIGRAMGRKDEAAIRIIAYVNILFGAVCMLIIWGMFILFSKKLIGIDIDVHDKAFIKVAHYAGIFFIFGGVVQLLDNLRFVTIGVLRGLNDTKKSMEISFIAFWLIAFPSAYCFSFLFNLGAIGLLLGLLVGIISGFILQLRRLYKLMSSMCI